MRNLDDPKPLGSGSFVGLVFWYFAKFASIVLLCELIIVGVTIKFDLENFSSEFNVETLTIISFFLLYLSYLLGWATAMHNTMPYASSIYSALGAIIGSSFVTLIYFILTSIYDPQPPAGIIGFFIGMFFMSWFGIAGVRRRIGHITGRL